MGGDHLTSTGDVVRWRKENLEELDSVVTAFYHLQSYSHFTLEYISQNTFAQVYDFGKEFMK